MARFFRPAVFRNHGLLVGSLCHLFLLLRLLSPWDWIHWLARGSKHSYVVDPITGKNTPMWQDGVVLFGGAVTLLSVFGVQQSPETCFYKIGLVVGSLHLIGIFVFQVNVLFFDDLVANNPKVTSMRRLFFQATFNMVETVALFAAWYVVYGDADGFREALRWSIQGLTLNVPVEWGNSLGGRARIWSVQVGMSMFFIVILLATLASQVFRRGEIAPGRSDDES